MDPKRYQRLKELVNQALELHAYERDAFLQAECSDPELLLEARDLLRFRGEDGDTLSEKMPLTAEMPDLVDKEIGPYKIIETLGEGGMGVVYLADQSAPLRRQVALKVIKLGMDTKEVITRFESERQALAMMDHPNIARVFDAGVTPEGRPYFVMEYIPGIPLMRYCTQEGLNLEERLNVFEQICNGIHHAHQKGIIHRDLKPANILITEAEGKPVPKIIDFGVAKATSQHLAAQTLFTRQGQVVGTPEYMSPEQAGHSVTDVDTRSDVYSLGVLLYELLTGVLPLERQAILQAGLQKMALLVQNEVPPKPSTRVSTRVKQSGKTLVIPAKDPRTWVRKIQGDLDWITMKALEKEPKRRYGTVAELVQDIHRHREGRAVSAGPPSGTYRLKKFVGRNRVGVALAATALISLIGIAIWQTVQSGIIAREKDHAQTERTKAQANERLAYGRQFVVEDPTLGFAYGLGSLELEDQPGARELISQALIQGRLRDEFPRWGQRGNAACVDISPGDRFGAVAWTQSQVPTVGLYSLADQTLRVLKGETEGIVYYVAFTSDGGHVVATGFQGIEVWRTSDGKHLHHFPVEDSWAPLPFPLNDPNQVAFSFSVHGGKTIWRLLDIEDMALQEMGTSVGIMVENWGHNPNIDRQATRILDYDRNTVYLQAVGDLDSDRALIVGNHDATILTVAQSGKGELAASVDTEGLVKIWDLRSSPSRLIREHKLEPGGWFLWFDPNQTRVTITNGSGTGYIWDLSETPPRDPVPLLGRTHWLHSGVFLSDGSVLTGHNGTTCPVVWWKKETPWEWSLDLSHLTGKTGQPVLSRNGQTLYLWDAEGHVIAYPLAQGVNGGTREVAKAGGWMPGAYSFIAEAHQTNQLLIVAPMEGPSPYLVDTESGRTRTISSIEVPYFEATLDPEARFAAFKNSRSPQDFKILDLQTLEEPINLHLESPDFRDFTIADERDFLTLSENHVIKVDWTNPEAMPDTLWTGDASQGGRLVDDGKHALVRGEDGIILWLNLEDGRQKPLGEASIYKEYYVAYNPRLDLLAIYHWLDPIHIFDLKNDLRYTIPQRPGKKNPAITEILWDPLDRWMLTFYQETTLAWKLPLDPLLSEMDFEDYVREAASRTNVRIVPDESQPNGFRITNTTDPDS